MSQMELSPVILEELLTDTFCNRHGEMTESSMLNTHSRYFADILSGFAFQMNNVLDLSVHLLCDWPNVELQSKVQAKLCSYR